MPANPLIGAFVAVLLGAATPTPFPFDLSTPPPSPLPQIGRVRASSAACSAIHDVVVPSLLAAQHANARYRDVAKRLRSYVDTVDDESYRGNTVYRDAALSKLDQDVIALREDALKIQRALGDPRISKRAAEADPAIAAVRSALEKVYDGQAVRANMLEEYTIRERYATNKEDMSSHTDPFGGTSHAPAPLATATPQPGFTPPPMGMPDFHGMTMADTTAIDDWARQTDAIALAPEPAAARAFATVAKRC